MKSIMKWIAGIFLAFSLILSFFTPFEKALTLNLLLLYFFVKQFLDSTSSPRTYQWIFQVIYLLIFSGLIWFNLRHGYKRFDILLNCLWRDKEIITVTVIVKIGLFEWETRLN